ncbi:Fic family protein [Cloacibacillus sp.]|uniref:Fic family protein n=1 Tax=Cloacibacillus sp. TaxID=2049023 RepID=UPI0025C6E92B|nr:Fic family protein [Cloacibacillus sp.]MCC8058781.1 Fic family protein [Cloacibacillus sp.]
MKFLSSADTAKKWKISERAVRGYCAQGRVPEAFLTGKTWNIPETAEKPSRIPKARKAPATLLEYLRREKESGLSGGIYHKVQVDLTYNSNHIEGSRLTHDQTRYIFETNTIGVSDQAVNLDDVVETANHFRCIDMIIDNAARPLSESFILELHAALKSGTSGSRKGWFAVGKYKRMPNEVGGRGTAAPEEVPGRMRELLASYNSTEKKTLAELIDFHVRFEAVHPFQDGNGRVGRLILFKECLRNNIVPFIINEELKIFYYRGIREWDNERGYLIDTCLTAQDSFKEVLDYFRIPYKK